MNRKRRQIIAHLMRQETIDQSTPHRDEQLQIHHRYFGRLSSNLLWFYKANTRYVIGPKEEIKAFARLDRGPQYPVISAMSEYSQGYRMDSLNDENDVPEECSVLDPRGIGKTACGGRENWRMSLTGRRVRWRAMGLVGRIHWCQIYLTVDVDVKCADMLLTMV